MKQERELLPGITVLQGGEHVKKYLWGIRHLRYWWHRSWEQSWAPAWYRSGRYSGPAEYLDAIWRGEE